MIHCVYMAHAEEAAVESPTASDLNAFQQTILVILAEEARYGLAIKRELQNYYGSEVNHSRLYPTLDDLADRGLVEKSARDKRTNEYALAETGRDVLLEWFEWLFATYVTDADRADELRERLAAALEGA